MAKSPGERPISLETAWMARVMTTPNSAKRGKATHDDARDRVALAAIGLEAEFAIVVDGHPAKPEDVFGSPTQIVRAPMDRCH